MAVECRECEASIVDNALFCEHCGATQYPDLTRPSAVAVPEHGTSDPWVPHLLRTVGTGMLLALAWMTFVLGLLWRMHILDVTGYRKRDVLWLWVPIVGTVGEVRTLWRYTARDVYWEPRDDRPSATLQNRSVPVWGWIAGGAAAAIGVGAWVAYDPEIHCVGDRVRAEMEGVEEDEFRFGELGDALDEAFEECDVDFGRANPRGR